MKFKNKVYLEVSIKNSLIFLIFGVFVMPEISYEFEALKNNLQGTVISMLGFLMAAVIIGAFELTYQKLNLKSSLQRYLIHSSKFCIYLAIYSLMWIGYKTMTLTDAYFNDWILFSEILIVISIFLYDIFDIIRAVEINKVKINE